MALSRQDVVTERPTVVKGSRRTDNHTYRYSLDSINHRMIVHSYSTHDLRALVKEWNSTCRQHRFGKLIVQARESEWQPLLRCGFVMEGTIPSFFQGEPVYYMSKFFDKKRQNSQTWMDEEDILEQILLLKQPQAVRPLPVGSEVLLAEETHIPEMVQLFEQVFDTYPSPLTDPDYLRKSLQNDLFVICRFRGRIVSAAGAEIDRTSSNAEMTNCATLPEFRRYGLMHHIFTRLEQELAVEGIHSLYSIARSRSFGMNWVLRQHGYSYRGRLVNNCDICGGLENMNLWAKVLETRGGQTR